MKVIENKPAPVVQPPTTYDITGLTRAEYEHITIAVGELTKDKHDDAKARRSMYRNSTFGVGSFVYNKLYNALLDCQ